MNAPAWNISVRPLPPAATPVPPKESLDEVFKGIRKEASRKGIADQSAQHLKLARTYLEMGMLDEATAALKNAVKSPRQRFEAASLLGLVRLGFFGSYLRGDAGVGIDRDLFAVVV